MTHAVSCSPKRGTKKSPIKWVEISPLGCWLKVVLTEKSGSLRTTLNPTVTRTYST